MVADVNLTHLFRINQTPPIFMAPLENIVILKKYIYNEKHEILKARKVYNVEKYSQIKKYCIQSSFVEILKGQESACLRCIKNGEFSRQLKISGLSKI